MKLSNKLLITVLLLAFCVPIALAVVVKQKVSKNKYILGNEEYTDKYFSDFSLQPFNVVMIDGDNKLENSRLIVTFIASKKHAISFNVLETKKAYFDYRQSGDTLWIKYNADSAQTPSIKGINYNVASIKVFAPSIKQINSQKAITNFYNGNLKLADGCLFSITNASLGLGLENEADAYDKEFDAIKPVTIKNLNVYSNKGGVYLQRMVTVDSCNMILENKSYLYVDSAATLNFSNINIDAGSTLVAKANMVKKILNK